MAQNRIWRVGAAKCGTLLLALMSLFMLVLFGASVSNPLFVDDSAPAAAQSADTQPPPPQNPEITTWLPDASTTGVHTKFYSTYSKEPQGWPGHADARTTVACWQLGSPVVTACPSPEGYPYWTSNTLFAEFGGETPLRRMTAAECKMRYPDDARYQAHAHIPDLHDSVTGCHSHSCGWWTEIGRPHGDHGAPLNSKCQPTPPTTTTAPPTTEAAPPPTTETPPSTTAAPPPPTTAAPPPPTTAAPPTTEAPPPTTTAATTTTTTPPDDKRIQTLTEWQCFRDSPAWTLETVGGRVLLQLTQDTTETYRLQATEANTGLIRKFEFHVINAEDRLYDITYGGYYRRCT